jgi:hypothetical protein
MTYFLVVFRCGRIFRTLNRSNQFVLFDSVLISYIMLGLFSVNHGVHGVSNEVGLERDRIILCCHTSNLPYGMPMDWRNILSSCNFFFPIAIMLLSETHFTQNSYMRIPNYTLYHTTHPAGTARGGTVIIIKKHYQTSPSIQLQSRLPSGH